jgi:hypothetical protein
MQLLITNFGKAFKVSSYGDTPVQPWVTEHPEYKRAVRFADKLIFNLGMEYVDQELAILGMTPYCDYTPFMRGVFASCSHYKWCVVNGRNYYPLSDHQ